MSEDFVMSEDLVTAKARNVDLSPQKARLVADMIRGKSLKFALNQLQLSTKKAAPIIEKVVNSAAHNAEHNNNYDMDLLYIAEIFVDQARVFKRIKTRAKGRADRIIKRRSHIVVRLGEKRSTKGVL